MTRSVLDLADDEVALREIAPPIRAMSSRGPGIRAPSERLTRPRLTAEGSGHMVLCNDKVDRKFRVNKSRRSR